MLESRSLFGVILADPHEGAVGPSHGLELARGLLGNDEVGNSLEGFLLAHDEADALVLVVSEELCIARAAFLPLIISKPVQLDLVLVDADLFLGAGDAFDVLEAGLNALGGVGVGVVDVVVHLNFSLALFCHLMCF